MTSQGLSSASVQQALGQGPPEACPYTGFLWQSQGGQSLRVGVHRVQYFDFHGKEASYKHKWYFTWSCICLVAQLWLTLFDAMDGSLPGSSVCGIFQARILEWVAVPFARGSSQPRDRTNVFCASYIASGFFACWALGEAIF